MNNNKIITGISFLVLGILTLLSNTGFIALSLDDIIGIVLVLYSIPTVYYSLTNDDRTKLVSATILFLIGVLILVKSYYEILDTRGIIFASILFINGSVLLILFIDNTKEKVFLTVAAVSIILSYLSITLFNQLGLFNSANKIATLTEVFWPVILIVMGISIFINRKK